MTAWTRSRRPSFPSRCETCDLTVASDTTRAAAISALESPSLVLALGQQVEIVGGPGYRGGKPPRDLVEELTGHRGREHRVSGRHGSYRGDDLLGRGVLEEKAAGAGTQRLEDVLVEPKRGQDQHALSREPPGGFDAVDSRHPDVHQHDVGCVLAGGSDGLLAVACLGDDLDVAGGLEHGFEPRPHHRLIVRDHHTELRHDGVGA
jgi:hypothetical protein